MWPLPQPGSRPTSLLVLYVLWSGRQRLCHPEARLREKEPDPTSAGHKPTPPPQTRQQEAPQGKPGHTHRRGRTGVGAPRSLGQLQYHWPSHHQVQRSVARTGAEHRDAQGCQQASGVGPSALASRGSLRPGLTFHHPPSTTSFHHLDQSTFHRKPTQTTQARGCEQQEGHKEGRDGPSRQGQHLPGNPAHTTALSFSLTPAPAPFGSRQTEPHHECV